MSAVVQEPLSQVHLRWLVRAVYLVKAMGMSFAFRLLASLALLAVQTSSGTRMSVNPVTPHDITLSAIPLINPKIELDAQLKLVRGWALVSNDDDFGGLSGLLTDGTHFTVLSDRGLFARFALGSDSQIEGARIDPLPSGCALDEFKSDRDSESIARNAVTGETWIGFEWRNAICRASPGEARADALVKPSQMRHWMRTTGPEAMVRVKDGRFLIFQEGSVQSAQVVKALLFSGDPTTSGTKARSLTYKLPTPYFFVTDAAQLPDGRLLVLHRNFKPPFQFRAKLSIVEKLPGATSDMFEGRVLASLSEKGLTDNFEGVAVSQAEGRTFIWLVSDDNYLWLQHTYLLQFELLKTPA